MMSRGRRASGFGSSLPGGVLSVSRKSSTSRGSWAETSQAMDYDSRLSYQSSRGFDEKNSGREREGRDDDKLRSEAQRLAAAYFAAQGVTPDQLTTLSSEGSRADGGIRGPEGYSGYRGLEREKSKSFLERSAIAESSLGFDSLTRRSGGEEGRGKHSFLRYNEPEYTYSDLKPQSYVGSSGPALAKSNYDEYSREGRPRDTRAGFLSSSRHERDAEAYGKESYDPFRTARRGRRREVQDYESGRKYAEEDTFSVRGSESVLGKRKSKPYDAGGKNYYADKKPAYMATLEAEHSKGETDLDEYDYEDFGRTKGEGLGIHDGVGGLMDPGGSRSLLDAEYLEKGARKDRDHSRVVKSEIYDRRSSLNDNFANERDSERSLLSSRGRRGRRPSSRGSYSGDYHDGSDFGRGVLSRGRYLDERLGDSIKHGGSKSDYRYSTSHASMMLGRDSADGYRHRSHESATDKPYESSLDLERIHSPLQYELGSGPWRSRSSDVGGRTHDLVERVARDKLAFLHHSDYSPAFFPSRGGHRSLFSKHRAPPPDFHDRDLWVPGFRGGRRGRGRGRGISHADELFRMHNMKAKTWSEKLGDEHAEPRYRGYKRHGHRSPHSQEQKESSKVTDWDATAVEQVDAAVDSKETSVQENGALQLPGDKQENARTDIGTSSVATEPARTPLREEVFEKLAEPKTATLDLNVEGTADVIEQDVTGPDQETLVDKDDADGLVVETPEETQTVSTTVSPRTSNAQDMDGETRAREDRAYELYTKLFEENVTLRKMYEEQLNSGSFDCLVCFDSGSG